MIYYPIRIFCQKIYFTRMILQFVDLKNSTTLKAHLSTWTKISSTFIVSNTVSNIVLIIMIFTPSVVKQFIVNCFQNPFYVFTYALTSLGNALIHEPQETASSTSNMVAIQRSDHGTDSVCTDQTESNLVPKPDSEDDEFVTVVYRKKKRNNWCATNCSCCCWSGW